MDDDYGDEGDAADHGVLPTGVDPPPRATLELDHVYEALAHPRRRYLCYALLEESTWSLRELATKVAAREADVADRAVSDEQRDRMYVSLYHAHVPKLVDEGVLAFDEASETVTPAGNAKEVLAALAGLGATLGSDQDQYTHEEMNDEAR